MKTKQTPEDAADESLRGYSDWSPSRPSQYNARLSIVKTFQDRERLLIACELAEENLAPACTGDHLITGKHLTLMILRDAIAIAKEK